MSDPYEGGYPSPPPPPGPPGGFPTQQQTAWNGPPAPGGGDPTSTGFFSGLFDLSFTKFITIKFVRVIYILAIIAASLSVLVTLIIGFSVGPLFGILGLILGVVAGILWLTFLRISLEFFVVVFRIGDNVTAIRNRP